MKRRTQTEADLMVLQENILKNRVIKKPRRIGYSERVAQEVAKPEKKDKRAYKSNLQAAPYKVSVKPLSVNEAWQGKRFKTPKYKQYSVAVMALLPNIDLPAPPYKIYFCFGFSNKLSDWDNPIKPTTDILATFYGFNDKLIRKAVIETEIVPKGQEYFEFLISQL